jgi:thiamine biosynthesis lipoprotein
VHAEWFKQSEGIMGTPINVELWSHSETLAKDCSEKVMQEMRRIDSLMSPYKPESELAIINSMAFKQPVKVGAELFKLIERSIALSELSGGAFDITFASIGYQYDYRKGDKPTDQQIQAQLDRINYRHILLDKKQSTVRFAKQGVKIDLGGIAKGYAVDNGIRILRECGIKRALVSAGGDTRIIGDRKGRPWMTGIRDPRNKDKSVVVIPLSDTALSTSGDYERYFIKDGVRYHHILSPKTGKSVDKTRSVTVIGPDAVTTDGLSTTLFVLGPEKGLALAERLEGIDAVIIDATGRIHYSSGLMPPSGGNK